MTLLLGALLCTSCSAAYWGVRADFADAPPEVSERIASVLAQRGINAVLLNTRGTQQGWFNWTKVQKAWEDAGTRVFWDAPSTLAECDRIQGLGNAVAMSGEPMDRGTSYLSPRWASEIQRTASSLAFMHRSALGYRVIAEAAGPGVSNDPEAVRNWQGFVAAFFRDASPADDTNADHCTFNTSFGTDYTAWSQVPVFAEPDSADTQRHRLAKLWTTSAHADYVNAMCGTLSPLTQESLCGPEVSGPRPDSSDTSVLASRKFVRLLWSLESKAVPEMDCAAAVFGRKVFAGSLTLNTTDAVQACSDVLRLLPYVDGAFFEYDSLASTGAGKLDLTFYPAFDAVPLLAPFVGRFKVNRANSLWILPAEDRPDGVLDAYCVSESALALDPDCVDLAQYRAVIYLNQSPCVSTVILQRLFDYAVRGGVVLLDAYNIGQGRTLHGRDNAPFWWEDLRLERERFGTGVTTVRLPGFAAASICRTGTDAYLTGTPGRFMEVGEVKDSTGASYPLLLIRKMGKTGKWVYINLPNARNHTSLVRAVVKSQAGVDLPNPADLRVYTGDRCALAIGPEDIESVQIPCGFAQAVVFDPFSKSARVVKPENGSLTVPGKLYMGGAMLWVIKPYGRPILVYADGTTDRAGSIEDGDLVGDVLRFRFQRRAYVSSPEKPLSVKVDGRESVFDYDQKARLLSIQRTNGSAAQAEISYKQ